MRKWGSIDHCLKCDYKTKIVNAKYGLCGLCNKKRLEAERGAPKKRKSICYKKKPTGELALFQKIYNSDRPKRCIVSHNPIPFFSVHFMSHIVGKGPHPAGRLDEENVQYMLNPVEGAWNLPDIHDQWEDLNKQWDSPAREEERWKSSFEIYDRKIIEYNKTYK